MRLKSEALLESDQRLGFTIHSGCRAVIRGGMGAAEPRCDRTWGTMPRPAEAKLWRLLGEIFADNVVTAEERALLIDLQAELPPQLVARVFAQFVEKKWGEALADGVVTEEEKLALQRVLEELQLPEAAVPADLRRVLRE